jgi:glucose/mannose transport system permease protein
MTGPGTGFSTDVPALFMYDTTFRGNRFAEGSAIAMILLILVALLVIPYLVNSYKSEEER